ncbi:MAG: hypothetical protein ACKJSG_11980 [Lentisphaeria bacterium]
MMNRIGQLWTIWISDGLPVVIEYPVKCVNVSERELYYQTDTGPVLLPNDRTDTDLPIERFDLAYVAHNCPDWAEFIVSVPTPVSEGVSVDHYSESRRVETTTNRLIEV